MTGRSGQVLAGNSPARHFFFRHRPGKGGLSPVTIPRWDWAINPVPLYEYELCEGTCAPCGGRFTLRRPLNVPELTACPACRRPIRKLFSAFSTPSITKPVSISDAKKAGFTVLKRVSKGEYERQ